MATSAISALGAGSGIDVKALAQSLVDAEKAPRKEAIDKKVTQSEARISGYSAIRFVLDQLRTAFQGLNNPSDLNKLSINNSQTAAFTASANSTVAPGAHSVVVKSLASAQRSLGNAYATGTDTISNSDFVLNLQVGPLGKLVEPIPTPKDAAVTYNSITVKAADATPEGVVNAINAANLGITAQLMKTASGTQIVTTGQTGENNAFSLSSDVGLSFSAIAGETAKNATLTVDGVNLTRSNNSVDDAISGVTLNLLNPTNISTDSLGEVSYSPASVTFARDTSAIKGKLEVLVSAYNDVESVLKDSYSKDSVVQGYGASLVGDSTVQTVRSQIRQMVVGFTSAPTTSTTSVKALRDLGVSINVSGQLTLDEKKLNTALTSKYSESVTMLSNNIETYVGNEDAGIAGDAIRNLDTLLGKDGLLMTQSTSASKRIDEYKLQLEKLEARMTLILERYNKQFGAMESLVGQTNSLRTSLTSTFEGMMATYTNN